MGQGLGAGAIAGSAVAVLAAPLKLGVAGTIAVVASGAGAGLTVDFLSDCFAREGKVIIHRDVILNASDILRHVSTFYAPCVSHPWSRRIRQKHEWLILESHTNKFYVVQKNPVTGDVTMDMRTSARSANDVGLKVAGQPIHTGETRQRRQDQEFDLPNDLQVAYVVAWLKKEDARWSLSTENSRHFTTRLRTALNDF